jgi:uncharacterized membrane protein
MSTPVGPAGEHPGTPPEENEHVVRVRAARLELARLEELLCAGHHPVSGPVGALGKQLADTAERAEQAARKVRRPAWLRVTKGESRWPVAAVNVLAIALQTVLPDRLTLVAHHWVMPVLELVLLLALVAANPFQFNRDSRLLRAGSLTLCGLITLANGWSAVRLCQELVEGRAGENAAPLLSTGAAIWLTNVIAFALWYWQFDRGGPAARANARQHIPDFMFPQMQTPELSSREWEPTFVDYLYVSFTNATAFSPTDVMPLSRWAKMTMMLQSVVSLVTVALVIARAVNILK